MQIVTKLPNGKNGKYPYIPTTNDQFQGEGVNYQTQIVTKLPNEKYPNLQCTNDQFWWGGGMVNYQTQIVTTKLPNENI